MGLKPRVLVTFSGKFGDILWQLPGLRSLHSLGVTVHLATMPTFAAVHELIALQPYIEKVYSIPAWACHDTACGGRPRIPPSVPPGYDAVVHLTYERHPSVPLILYSFTAMGVPWIDPPLPFLNVGTVIPKDQVAVAFNGGLLPPKELALKAIRRVLPPSAPFVNVEHMPFLEAARTIKASRFFFGCRSANWVLSCGVGQQSLIVEPEMGRRDQVFGCTWATEVMPTVQKLADFEQTAHRWWHVKD